MESYEEVRRIYDKWCYGPVSSIIFNIPLGKGGGIKLTNDMRALELGGYYGRDALECAQVVQDVLVVDIDKNSMELGSQLAKEFAGQYGQASSRVRYEHCDVVNDFDNAGGKYDLIYSYQLLHLFPEMALRTLFTKLGNWLSDRGRMVHMLLSDRCPLTRGKYDGKDKFGEHLDIKGQTVRHYLHDMERLSEMTRLAGFDSTQVKMEYREVVEFHPVVPKGLPEYHRHLMWLIYCKKQ